MASKNTKKREINQVHRKIKADKQELESEWDNTMERLRRELEIGNDMGGD
jgi:F0F1-type ATP synthase membrane subunit b/b'